MEKTTKIVDSAIKLFMSHDIRKVTMDSIAAKANVSKMTVYKYFGDKDSLYYHVGEAILNRLYTTIKNEHDSEHGIKDKIDQCFCDMRDFITQGYRTAALELAQLNNQFEEEYQFIDRQIKMLVIKMIEEGINAGVVRQDLSATTIYHLIYMELFYYQYDQEYQGKITHDELFRQEILQAVQERIYL